MSVQHAAVLPTASITALSTHIWEFCLIEESISSVGKAHACLIQQTMPSLGPLYVVGTQYVLGQWFSNFLGFWIPLHSQKLRTLKSCCLCGLYLPIFTILDIETENI